jgi:hypothetical protein
MAPLVACVCGSKCYLVSREEKLVEVWYERNMRWRVGWMLTLCKGFAIPCTAPLREGTSAVQHMQSRCLGELGGA